jgi:hypothetical protein
MGIVYFTGDSNNRTISLLPIFRTHLSELFSVDDYSTVTTLQRCGRIECATIAQCEAQWDSVIAWLSDSERKHNSKISTLIRKTFTHMMLMHDANANANSDSESESRSGLGLGSGSGLSDLGYQFLLKPRSTQLWVLLTAYIELTVCRRCALCAERARNRNTAQSFFLVCSFSLVRPHVFTRLR